MKYFSKYTSGLSCLVVLSLILSGCGKKGESGVSARDRASAAEATYVAPGEKDDYYLFYSGGHSGQVFVSGLPSMRHIITIPVFAPSPGTGYGFDVESKKLLGDYTWGDVHHPALSQTDSMYDGRWLFVNDNANNRVARIDLRDFKTKQIIGPLPNSSGSHASSFVTENTEFLFVSTRFSTPLPMGTVSELENYERDYNGMVTALKVDPESGEMSVGFQILMPPFNFDLCSTGKGPSSGLVFFTSYNTEMAHETLEVGASQLDRDLGAIVNWKAAAAAVAEGKGSKMEGVTVLDPSEIPGIVHFVGIAKSPHGIDVDPTGKWVTAGGKLQPTATVMSVEKILKAIEDKDYEGDFRNIPILTHDSVVEGEVPVGLGPLHTQYDGEGHGYTSLFIDSAITKWKLPPWTDEEKKDLTSVVLDKITVHYSIGHLVVAGSDTREPYGKWMVAMNKLSKGRHVSVGPTQPESSQLIDITGEKMKMVAEAYTDPEPHFAQILKVDAIEPIEVYLQEENKDPNAIWELSDGVVTREGANVTAKVAAIRSRFSPDKIEANVGDTVTIHVTNIEQTADMIHGFGINEHNINVVTDPGETKTIQFVAEKKGVFPFYCTNFCSALHQEMQGYLIVRDGGSEEPAAEADTPAPSVGTSESADKSTVSAAKEPAAKEPATQEPATQEPATQEPATEEPATQEPATQEPATQEPATQEPATQEPATEEPATEEPAAEEPVTEEAAVDAPTPVEPEN